MTVSPIGALMSAATAAPTSAQQTAAAGLGNAGAGTAGTGAAEGATGDFGNIVVNALQGVQDTQDTANSLAVKAATGDLVDVHNYTIAATEASLQTQLTVAVRDRAVEAFNQIMAMQV